MIESLFIDRRFIVEIVVGLAKAKVFIDKIVYASEKCPSGLNPKGFLHRKIMRKLSYLMGVKNPKDIL